MIRRALTAEKTQAQMRAVSSRVIDISAAELTGVVAMKPSDTTSITMAGLTQKLKTSRLTKISTMASGSE